MAVSHDDPAPRLLLRIAAGFYGLGMLVLLSPVSSNVLSANVDAPRVGDFYDDGSGLCGLTLTAFFVTREENDDARERKADCAAKAGDRVGYGLLSLALAAPFGVAGAVKGR